MSDETNRRLKGGYTVGQVLAMYRDELKLAGDPGVNKPRRKLAMRRCRALRFQLASEGITLDNRQTVVV